MLPSKRFRLIVNGKNTSNAFVIAWRIQFALCFYRIYQFQYTGNKYINDIYVQTDKYSTISLKML